MKSFTRHFLYLLLLYEISLIGCQMRNSLKPEEITNSGRTLTITNIEMIDGKTVRFDKDSLGYATCSDSSVYRMLPSGSVEAYRLSQISKVHTVRASTTGEDVAIIASISFGALMILGLAIGTIHIPVGG
jgi:hypothetical protein